MAKWMANQRHVALTKTDSAIKDHWHSVDVTDTGNWHHGKEEKGEAIGSAKVLLEGLKLVPMKTSIIEVTCGQTQTSLFDMAECWWGCR